jgi:hypothetical protein
VSVIEGEGRVPILYGQHSMPRAADGEVYLARPDLGGRHPGVLVVTDPDDRPSVIKDLARRLARYGYSVAVPEPVGIQPAAEAMHGAWSDWTAPGKFAVVGIGNGAAAAAEVAAMRRSPVVLISPKGDLDYEGPMLILGPEAGEVGGLSSRVVYHGAGDRFWDDSSEEYHDASARDASERIIGFLDAQLGVRIAR